jgi:hypothetical protein
MRQQALSWMGWYDTEAALNNRLFMYFLLDKATLANAEWKRPKTC